MAEKTKSTPLNAVFVNAFLNAIIEILETMASLTPTPGKPFIKKQDNSRGDISGIIGMAGHRLQGAFAISFQRRCIFDVVERMLGEPVTRINDDVIDCVGEITNMVSGVARANLSTQGHEYGMATPTVICSDDHTIAQATKEPVVVMPFTTPAGAFLVEVSLWRTES
ncbi:chemotaxis protein CheX [Myxococcota bacterium]|nr:chemotaxis protein CheX [Myxococcota bacterium]MBU1431597.1 chemotaxis protein CheX [Myxococcota bacterium]MBU1900390.1 chemotaxis protein CheX [Myxococcota bacterium]